MERRHEDNLGTEGNHAQAIHACKVGMCKCKVPWDVSHAPNCCTQMFLKVMTACKNVSAAMRAACAPPMKSSRKKATTPSSSVRAAGKACAVGKAASAARKAALRRSCRAVQQNVLYRLYAVRLLARWAYAILPVMAGLIANARAAKDIQSPRLTAHLFAS